MAISMTKAQSYDYELIALCHHEAGHCIIAALNLYKVSGMSVIDGNELEGNTDFSTPDEEAIKDETLINMLFISESQVYYAGYVTEKIYYKDICGSDSFPMHLKSGSSDDFQIASKMFRKYNLVKAGKERSLFKKKIQENLKNVCMEHWEDIKLIAHLLYKKQRLTYSDIKYALTKKSINKEMWQDKFKIIYPLYNKKKDLPDNIIKDIMLKSSLNSIK